MIDIIFIILNYKSYKDTVQLCKEILDQQYESFKIIVVDNASPNESLAIIQKELACNNSIDILESNTNGGYAKGNNIGLKYVERYNPRYVCVLNNDVHFTKYTIDQLIKIYPTLDRPAIVAPMQILPGEKKLEYKTLYSPTFFEDLLDLTPFTRKTVGYSDILKNQIVDEVPGAFLFVDYSVFKKLGFFCEDTFLFCEERFLGKAAKEHGYKNYIINSLSYLHMHSATIGTTTTRKFQRLCYQRGVLAYTKRYRKLAFFKCALLQLAFYAKEIKISIKETIKGK